MVTDQSPLCSGSSVTKASAVLLGLWASSVVSQHPITGNLPSIFSVRNHPSVHEKQRRCCRSGEYVMAVQPVLQFALQNELGGKANRSFLPFQVTGSGKTLAFVIPIVEILLRREEKLKKSQVRRPSALFSPSHQRVHS